MNLPSEHEDFLYELKQNRLLHSISNKVISLFENNYKSIGFVCLSSNCVQQDLILSLTKLVSRKKNADKMNVYFTHENELLKANSEYLLNDKALLKKIDDNIIDSKELEDSFDSSTKKLWDLPCMTKLISSYEYYLPVLEDIDVVFVLVPTKGTNKDEVIALKEYFQNFDIEVQGLVLEKKEQRSWWEFWK